MKGFIAKPVINKRNGQINFSLPKRKLTKLDLDNIYSGKRFKIRDLEWLNGS